MYDRKLLRNREPVSFIYMLDIFYVERILSWVELEKQKQKPRNFDSGWNQRQVDFY
jgi:hypothetical protein